MSSLALRRVLSRDAPNLICSPATSFTVFLGTCRWPSRAWNWRAAARLAAHRSSSVRRAGAKAGVNSVQTGSLSEGIQRV